MKRVVLVGMVLGSWCLSAAIVTNKWVATTSGRWEDAENWSDPIMLGTNEATAAFFDLSKLPSNSTNTISNAQWKSIYAYGLNFGSVDGSDDDTWLIRAEKPGNGTEGSLFKMLAGVDGVADVVVNKGTFRINGVVDPNGAVTRKLGAGTLRHLGYGNGPVRVVEGVLQPYHDRAFIEKHINLYSKNGKLDLSYNTSHCFMQVDSTTGEFTPIDTTGRAVRYGTVGLGSATLDEDLYTGSGVLAADSCQQFTLWTSPKSFTGTFRMNLGDVVMAESMDENMAGLYRFEDENDIGATLIGNAHLDSVGSVQVVNDAERGKVLYLNGSSYLSSANATKLPDGFPKGSDAYTVAFWIKLDLSAGYEPQATIFYMGKWNSSSACLLIRLDNTASSSGKGVMFTNFDNNQWHSTSKLYDGEWHHLAIQYISGGTHCLYMDGSKVSTSQSWQVPNIQDGEFWIGNGKNGKKFKGWIDDFVVSRKAENLQVLMSGKAFSESSVTLNPESSIDVNQSGKMKLKGNQTIKKLSGIGVQGVVVLDGDLTVTGTESSTFAGRVQGTGNLIKKGEGSDLLLSGVSTFTGAVKVVEGSVTLSGGDRASNMVGKWTFDNTTNPGEDSSASGNDLTSLNVSVVNDDKRGSVAYFNGTNARLYKNTLPESFPLGNSDYTLSMWIKGVSGGTANAGVAVWGAVNQGSQCALWRLDGSSGWMITNWGNNYSGTKGDNFRDDTWHHVVIVRAGASRRVYVDGKFSEEWQSTAVLDIKNNSFNLGYNPAASTYFKGYMDDVHLYAFALSEDEALAEYNGGEVSGDNKTTRLERLPRPLYMWDFEDESVPGHNTGRAEDGELSVVGEAKSVVDKYRSGKVLDLTGIKTDGSTTMSYLEATDYPAQIPTGKKPWTVMCWIRALNVGDELQQTFVYWGDPATYFMLFGYRGTAASWSIRCTVKSGMDANSLQGMPNGTGGVAWHHIAASYDGGNTVRVYLDGVEDGSQWVNDVNIGTGKFWIGRKASSETGWFRGYMDNVRVYDQKLEVSTIREILRAEMIGAEEPVVSTNTAVEVSEGATFKVQNASIAVKQVSGNGTLSLAAGSTLGVTEQSVFDGVTTGTGAFGFVDGVTLAGEVKTWPVLSAPNAKVTIPASGVVQFACEAKDVPHGTWTLAEGSQVVAPDDLSQWQVEPQVLGLVRFKNTGKAFTMSIYGQGSVFILR